MSERCERCRAEPLELDPKWKAEIIHRLAQIEAGKATFHDAQAHAQQLRANYE